MNHSKPPTLQPASHDDTSSDDLHGAGPSGAVATSARIRLSTLLPLVLPLVLALVAAYVQRATMGLPWPNGKLPTSEEWKALAASRFENYRLKVCGLVENPVELSLEELGEMSKRSQITLHHCIQGWSGIAEWGGLPLARADEAGATPDQASGQSSSIPLAKASGAVSITTVTRSTTRKRCWRTK
jgi:hypothetical protein